MIPPDPVEAEVRRRQKERARLTALLLGGFALLVFAITLVKLGVAL